jgi:hypothetical protein
VNSPLPDPAADFVRRLAAVEIRLRDLSRKRLEGRTDPDPANGESWDAGQIWAHLADFVPYWISQVERVLAADSPDPVPFGRARANADHTAATERDRHQGPNALWHDAKEDLSDLRALLGDISDRAWQTKGVHPTRGVITVQQLIEELLIGHLEHHATQLEGLRAG